MNSCKNIITKELMKTMKFSDLMLDFETGDASFEDMYVQEAVGKINVASAIFDNEYRIAETPEGMNASYIQEAAEAVQEAAEAAPAES